MPNNDERLYNVFLPYACFGIVVQGETIVKSAPIAKWAVGKPFMKYAEWVARKGGKLVRVDEENLPKETETAEE